MTYTVVRRCSSKQVFLRAPQNLQKNICARDFFNKVASLRYSCEFCEFFKNTFFIEHLWWLLLALSKHERIFQNLFLNTEKSETQSFYVVFVSYRKETFPWNAFIFALLVLKGNAKHSRTTTVAFLWPSYFVALIII